MSLEKGKMTAVKQNAHDKFVHEMDVPREIAVRACVQPVTRP